jgi:hypothetical protein
MLLKLTDLLDIGTLAKQRICFEVIKGGNLMGHYLYQGDYLFYIFPSWQVKKGDYVVLYVSPGHNKKQVFGSKKCHFLYYGEWIQLWDEQKETFRLVYRRLS